MWNNKNFLSGNVSHWSCSFCKSDIQLRNCCGFKGCEYSSFSNKTIEQMIGHLIGAHGYKPPIGWNDLKSKNKKHKKRRKK